jgi:hypothetical protein
MHRDNFTFYFLPLWLEAGFVSYEYAWPFVKCTYRIYSMLLKTLPFALYTSPLSVQAFQSRSCLSYLCYNCSILTYLTAKLLLALLAQWLRSESHGTHGLILLSDDFGSPQATDARGFGPSHDILPRIAYKTSLSLMQFSCCHGNMLVCGAVT